MGREKSGSREWVDVVPSSFAVCAIELVPFAMEWMLVLFSSSIKASFFLLHFELLDG